MRKLTILLFIGGCVLLYYLIQKVGFNTLIDSAKIIGWSSLLLIPLSIIWIIPNTLGFRLATDQKTHLISFKKLIVTRLVGESVNYLTPSGYLGGEALKATILAKNMNTGNASSVVFIAKTSQTLALLLFLLIGLILAKVMLILPSEVKIAASGSIILLFLGVLAMTYIAKGKSLSQVMRWINQRYSQYQLITKLNDFIHHMDDYFVSYFKQNKTRYYFSILMHFLGWALGAVEVFFITTVLGYSISMIQAFLLSSIASLFMVGGFFIPGSLGAFELGHYFAATMLHLPPEVGVSISLARRFREAVWLMIGLFLFFIFYRKLMKKNDEI